MTRGSLRFSEEQFRDYAAKSGFKVGTDQRLAAPVPPASTPPRVSGVGEAPKYPVTQLCEHSGIAIPEYEYRFHPSRRWRFDCAWREQMIALEIEGGVWSQGRHTRGAGFLGDMEKYNAAVLLGWRVLRTTPQTLADGVKSVRLLMA